MSTRRRLRGSTPTVLALVAVAVVGAGPSAGPAAAGTTVAGQVPAGVTDQDAREGAVSAILLGRDGRPTFVEVVAPTLTQAVRRAAAVPGSDGVEIDTPVTALATRDPLRPRQWGLDRLHVDRLPVRTDRGQHLVAVVDSGVRGGHEDFAPGQVLCTLGVDLTGEGLGPCQDPAGHGTHVAGIVGAATGNGKGVASIAPGTAILPVRVLDSAGVGGSTAVARGIVHAADAGAQVINLSLGGPGRSSALDAAVQYATDSGALVVVSAGNNRQTGNEVNYPAASPGALAVASTEASGASSPFSYSGPAVDLAAPGGAIWSTWGDGRYAAASGTSMAAPAVSAVASLYRAAHPAASPAEVAAALVSTATDLDAPGRDDRTGAGLVNPYGLLVGGTPPVVRTTPPPAPGVTTPRRPPAAVRTPAPRVRVVTPRVAAGTPIALQLADFRPASTVSVLEAFSTSSRVKVRGRWVTRTSSRTVLLATLRVSAAGTVEARVAPVRGVRDGRLVVRGFDRAGKVVQSVTAIRVG